RRLFVKRINIENVIKIQNNIVILFEEFVDDDLVKD
ncbi:unnamed protein product, partial [Rotaria sp. Silwood1]